jgi:hypothetical protein
MDKMSQEKGRQYDGRSRPTNDTYRKRWDEIFGKKEKTLHEELMEGYEQEKKNEIHIDYEYLESLKDKL